MTTIPLGQGAYKRSYAGEPEIRLENRFLETAPTNLREHVALLTRCGTNPLINPNGGFTRGNYSLTGLFDSDLFVCSGPTLYRYATDGTLTEIEGVVNGSGHPTVAWMKGIGYEYLFIADGLLLQFYNGGSPAVGTLTQSGGSITNQVIQIGTTYYSWSATVNAGSPDGTSSKPWLALLGGTDAESLTAMANLILFNGVRGVDFSSTLGGPSTEYTAVATATTLVITSISTYAAANSIATLVTSGADLSWSATTLLGGGVHVLQGVPVPGGVGIKALASVSGYVLASVALSQEFFWLNPGETIIDPLDFAEKESNPDNIVEMLTVGDQVIICGDGSTENWYATGNFDAPFAPVEGRVYQRGVVDGTPVVVKDDFVIVGNDGIVYSVGYAFGTTAQWGVHRISNHGIEERIRSQLRREQGLT